ncbi:MAG: energy transducer TonB [Flavobacteriia bacterium]|nr:energy transducer TonB [Flavobacteriia bacterium]
MKIKIQQPCPEDWNNMKIGLIARHCIKCDKNVIDFTTKSKLEIIEYLLNHPNETICGRINQNRVEIFHEDIPILLKELRTKNNTNAFYIISIVCMSLLSCNANNHKTSKKTNTILLETNDTLRGGELKTVQHQEKITSTINTENTYILGDISLLGKIPNPNNKPFDLIDSSFQLVEKMPEYPGGIDELYNFFKANLKYPKQEKKKQIEGTIYLKIIIDESGVVINPKIVKNDSHSIHFENEVLRVTSKMGFWKPGSYNGKNVPTEYTLPIEFSLIR